LASASIEIDPIVDSEEIIQQLDDHLDETDNILMRTSEQAVAESIADLQNENIGDKISNVDDDSDLEILENQSHDHLTGSGVSIASLASSSKGSHNGNDGDASF